MVSLAENPNGARALHIGIALAVIDTVAVFLRLLARWRSKASFAMDDFLIVVSIFPFYGMVVLSYFAVDRGGLGMPITAVEPSQVSVLMQLLMATVVTYSFTITLVKISILCLYRRIFSTQAFRQRTVMMGTACVVWCLLAIFIYVFQCRPFKAAFDLELLFTYHCINLQSFYLGITAVNIALDVVLLYLPLHEVWKLEMRDSKKIKLSGIFLLGSVVCIAGIMRMVTVGNLQTEDITVTLVAEYSWSQAEPATAIFAACIVTYRPLFAYLGIHLSRISSIFSGSGRSQEQNHGSGSNGNGETPYSWARRQESDHRLQKLNVKAAGKGLHIVQIDLGTSDPAGQMFYQQPRLRHDV